MDENFCNCHEKHKSKMNDLKEGIEKCHESHKDIWNKINQKIDTKWLIVLIPVFLFWLGFQMTMYNGMKNVETKISVIQNDISYIKKTIDMN